MKAANAFASRQDSRENLGRRDRTVEDEDLTEAIRIEQKPKRVCGADEGRGEPLRALRERAPDMFCS
jgi:hypothetical protein